MRNPDIVDAGNIGILPADTHIAPTQVVPHHVVAADNTTTLRDVECAHIKVGNPNVPGPDDTLGTGLLTEGDQGITLHDVVVDLEPDIGDNFLCRPILRDIFRRAFRIRVENLDGSFCFGDERSRSILPYDDGLDIIDGQIDVIENIR